MSVAASTPEAWATLSLKALPHQPLVALLRAFGDPASVLAATRAQLSLVAPDVVAARVQAPVPPEALAATRDWLADPNHQIIAWDDPDYPRALLDLGYSPPALFFVGRRELLNRPALAIIGSRNATAQGAENARAFATALSHAGLTIVSGLAVGIDAAAHRGAMEGEGSTLAVVGTGLDRVYPASNRDLAHRIAERGGPHVRIPAGHARPGSRTFPAAIASSAGSRAGFSWWKRRGGGVTHHRPPRGRTRARGIRDSRIDSFAGVARLPRAHQARCQARRRARGRARGTPHGRGHAAERGDRVRQAPVPAIEAAVLDALGGDSVERGHAGRPHGDDSGRRSWPRSPTSNWQGGSAALPGGLWQRLHRT